MAVGVHPNHNNHIGAKAVGLVQKKRAGLSAQDTYLCIRLKLSEFPKETQHNVARRNHCKHYAGLG